MRPGHPRLIRIALACSVALAAVPAAAAHAATLTTDARCYPQGAPLRMTATGLMPNAPLTVALDGQALRYRNGGTPSADAAGSFASSFATPALAPGLLQRRHVLSVSDGTRRPHARFTVTRPTGADFAPSSGSPQTLRARFSVWGFALSGGAPHVRVWLHWIGPSGSVRMTAPLGAASGDCGMLTTAPRRVFPFVAAPGRWVLAFDTHRRYRAQAGGPHAKIAVHVRSLSLPATASAASRIVLSPGCYLSSATGLLTGSGFTPNATWTAKLSGTKQIGTGRIDARGRIRARFTAPHYHGTVGTRTLTLSVTDGPHVASTTFQLTPLTASFSPHNGDPKTLRVRWRVLGLGPDHGVYIHYVAPNGKLKTTLRIGTSRGACGTLKTGPIALFPFRYTYGTWTLQVDASRRYSARTTPRLLIGFQIRRPRKSRTR